MAVLESWAAFSREFAFLFAAPVLFLVLTGTSLAVATLLDVKIGFGFSAGFIDYVINFTKPRTENPVLIAAPLGIGYALIYYSVFSFFIKRSDLATPGRVEASTGLGSDWILPDSQRGPRAG